MNLELGNGIRLTEIRQSDRDALVEFLNDPAVHRATVRIPFPYTAADADKWFDIVERSTAEHGQPHHWAIRSESGKLIGDIGLSRERVHCAHRAEMGYWLAKPFWGRGVMTSAVAAVCRHAFDNLGLVRIAAHVFDFNVASARVLEKCGFEPEGYLKKHYLKHGEFFDAKAYGLVR